MPKLAVRPIKQGKADFFARLIFMEITLLSLHKKTFVALLSVRLGISKADASRFFDGFLDILFEALGKKKTVTFRGFGKFFTKRLRRRKMRSPQTGRIIQVPARTVARFRTSKSFRNRIKDA